MEYVVAIDGGGTKTVAVLVDISGTIIASATTGATNPNVVEPNELKNRFNQLLEQLNDQAPEAMMKVESLYAGMSGVGHYQTRLKMEQLLQVIVPTNMKVQVEPDSMNALYSGTYGQPGIVQIAGTGSICYGINAEGEEHRVGGWGYLFGDEGSGYDIGRRGIMAVLKSEDGRAEPTILTDLLLSYFQVTNGRNLIEKIYHAKQPKEKVSPLSKIIFQAYKRNDLVAEQIIHDVVEEICHALVTVYRQLFNEEQVQAVLCGGVFTDREVLPSLIQKQLEDRYPITTSLPKMPPIGGSVIKALSQQQLNLDNKIIDQLIQSFNNKSQ